MVLGCLRSALICNFNFVSGLGTGLGTAGFLASFFCLAGACLLSALGMADVVAFKEDLRSLESSRLMTFLSMMMEVYDRSLRSYLLVRYFLYLPFLFLDTSEEDLIDESQRSCSASPLSLGGAEQCSGM